MKTSRSGEKESYSSSSTSVVPKQETKTGTSAETVAVAPLRTENQYGTYHKEPDFKPEKVVYHNHDYYYRGGVYYRLYGDSYCVCRPPVGAYVPRSYYRNVTLYSYAVRVNGVRVTYYYDDGVFFLLDTRGDRFEVVRPPVGFRFRELPSSYEEYMIRGERYFVLDDVVFQDYGSYYRVVGYRSL